MSEDNFKGIGNYSINLYEEEWIIQSPDTGVCIEKEDTVLIFGQTEAPIYNDIITAENSITVYKGTNFAKKHYREYEILPDRYEDYIKLMEEIGRNGLGVHTIIFDWIIEDGVGYYAEIKKITNGEKSICDLVNTPLTEGVYNLFYLIKAIIHTRWKAITKIFVINEKKEEIPNPFHEIIVNYGKSLGFILPELKITTIHISEREQLAAALENELKNAVQEKEVFYNKNKRYVRNYKKLFISNEKNLQTNTVPIKKGSVFLITGGAGKLGLLFAKFLGKEFSAKVVLVGRSELDYKKEAAIEELKLAGIQVVYYKADVTDKAQMEQVILNAKKIFGEIHGVIHAAGIVGNQLLPQKEYKEFKETLQVKMLGTLVLDEVTKKEPLSHFILFSSTASILGDFGQCDYSLGNRFLDCYKELRKVLQRNGLHSGETITINWPLWEEGGMHQEEETEKLYLKTSGLGYLQNDSGLHTFEQILALHKEQVIVFYGNESNVTNVLGRKDNSSDTTDNGSSRTALQSIKHNGNTPREYLEQDLSTISADILKVKEEEIDYDINFGEFGFDSISLKIFVKRIGEKFNIEISPAVFFSANTIRSLAVYLVEGFHNELEEYYKKGKKSPLQADLVIAEISKANDTKTNKYSEGISKTQERRGALVPYKKQLKTFHNYSNMYTEPGENHGEPVAIIGMEGVFPGSKDVNQFWDNIRQGRDLITEIPKSRWDWRAYYSENRLAKNKSNSKCGGFIDDVDKFDATFFNISPMEAELMDPQQRLLLQLVWKAVEDAGYKASELSGRQIGVYMGVQFNDYQELLQESEELKPQIVTGNAHAVIANRISYFMNFKGPSEAIDTACSGSLIAIHNAVKSIQRGESEMAVAGGVSLMLSPRTFLSASKLGVLSADNRCKTFDADANGYVRGEGIGVILLKPLKQAVKDGDNIYAVIKGSAQNHGGRANSLTAPNSDSQAAVISAAYKDAGITPDTVTYIEAHGTGTELGDPVEIEGLKKGFQEGNKAYESIVSNPQCGLGSVKTNIGHLEPAAGVAGIIKVILAMKNGEIPPSIHFKKLNPYIHLEHTPFYIAQKAHSWNRLTDKEGKEIPRRAGVSSFGFGGANAHIVLEEYKTKRQKEEGQEQIIILSARSEENLKEYAKDLLAFLNDSSLTNTCYSLENIAFTLQSGREAMNVRLAIIASDFAELSYLLLEYIKGNRQGNLIWNNIKNTQSSLELLYEDEDATGMIEQWISKKKFLRLAKLWTSGYEIDWMLFYKDRLVNRISLPTYPFTKQRYWFAEGFKSMNFAGNTNSALDTLIDKTEYLRSFEGEIVFSKVLSKEDTIVKEHVIKGQSIFPGVGYIEMAYQAAAVIYNSRELEISKLFWLSPLIVGDAKVKLCICLKKAEDHLLFEVKEDAASAPIVYAKGEIHKKAVGSEKERISLQDIKDRCTRVIKGEELYTCYQKDGIDYGGYFRGIDEVYTNDTEALGRIHIPAGSGPDLHAYSLHPTLLDSALQIISCIAGSEGKINLPFTVGRFKTLKPLESLMYSYVKKDSSNSYEVALINDEGELCGIFYKYVLKELRERGHHLYYQPQWSLSPVSNEFMSRLNSESELSFKEPALLIYTKAGGKLADFIAGKHKKALHILLGEKNTRKVKDLWEVKYDDPTALGDTIAKVKEKCIIYFLGGIGEEIGETEINTLLETQKKQECGVISLFRLVKALEKNNLYETSLTLKVITNNVYSLEEGKVTFPNSSSIHGFVKSLAKEYPRYKVSSVDIDLTESETVSLKEFSLDKLGRVVLPAMTEPQNSNGETVAYRNNNRYEQTIKEIQIPSVSKSVFKDKGVYLIVGGAGGVGLILSRYLAKTVKARLFLIGRSPLSDSKGKYIKEIEELGGTVTYYQADVTDFPSMEAAMREVKAIYGEKINGVFHSAIVPADKMIHNMKEEEFRAAFNPKVYGSVVLYSLLEKEALDFFAFFSSTSSQVGMAGQSNYVSGLNFKDNFAAYINRKTAYPVKVFNWGYLGIGSSGQEEFQSKMKRIGIHSISEQEAMEIVERVLANTESQVFLLKAENSVLKQMGILQEKGTAISTAKESYMAAAGIDDTKVWLEEYLKSILIDILKCDRDSIDNDTDFADFGVDSILSFQIHAEIEKSFGDLPATLFLNNSNINELVTYFLKNYGEKVEVLHGMATKNQKPAGGVSKEREGQKTGPDSTLPIVVDTLEKEERISDYIRNMIAYTLKCDADSIGVEESFKEYGIDSILGFQLYGELETSFGDIPTTLFLDYDTIRELVAYLMQNKEAEIDKLLQTTGFGKDLANQIFSPKQEKEEPKFTDLVKAKSTDVELPIDLDTFLVEIDSDTKMEVSVKGSGEPVLIIPGLAVTSLICSYQFIELSLKYQVIGINLPGHGRSDGIEDLSFKGISKVLVKVLDKLHIHQPIHVVGGSYGGIIAQNIALNYTRRVKSLTLIGSITATKFEGIAQIFSFTEAVSKDFEAVKLNAVSEDVLANIDYYFEIYKHSQSTNSPVLLKYLELMKIKMTTREVLEQIQVPTLILVGAIDTVVEPEESRLIHSKVKNSRYVEIADGGHFIHLTHHEKVSNAILDFLQTYETF
jgi:acyl transferase domain-containing protein/pimeloyl-ACP methyl ester carboxylesterase/acyl carrier protein/enoyl-[acyl-carrier-protein] reductase (NADH)